MFMALAMFGAQAKTMPAELVGKTITVIVPFGPGGNSDITARQLAKTVQKITGLNVVVSNRPGAGGVIGVQALMQAEPNGLTLGQFETGPAMVNGIQGLPNAPSRNQLVPVSASIENSLALVINADTPVRSVQEFVAWLKSKSTANYATTGGVSALFAEAFLDTAGVRGVQPIVYKSQAENLTSVTTNDTAFTFASVGDSRPLVDAKKVRVLALGSRKRDSDLSGVPTLAEIYPGFFVINYNGVFAPVGTPQHIVAYLNWAWGQAILDEETAAALIKRGNTPLGGDLDKAQHYYQSYYDSRERLYKRYRHLMVN